MQAEINQSIKDLEEIKRDVYSAEASGRPSSTQNRDPRISLQPILWNRNSLFLRARR